MYINLKHSAEPDVKLTAPACYFQVLADGSCWDLVQRMAIMYPELQYYYHAFNRCAKGGFCCPTLIADVCSV